MREQQPKTANYRHHNSRFGLIALTMALCLVSPAAHALEAGQTAPTFQAPLLDGNGVVALSDYQGKVVYLDFWASWCTPCATSLPLLDQLRGRFSSEEFQILAVNVDDNPDKGRRFLERHPVGYPSASDPDGAIPERFGVRTMPTAYLIDRAGVVRHVHSGFRRGDMPDLRSRIGRLIVSDR